MATELQGRAVRGHILTAMLAPLAAGEQLNVRLITSDGKPVSGVVINGTITLGLGRAMVLKPGDTVHLRLDVTEW
jgi:hypothetical protein